MGQNISAKIQRFLSIVVFVLGRAAGFAGTAKKFWAASSFLLWLPSGLSAQSVDTAWVRRYNGPGNFFDQAEAVAVDNHGNAYVTGYSGGSGSGYDYATLKYNSTGTQQWVARYNGLGNSDDYGRAITVGSSGNVYVAGESFGAGTSVDYATVKYNSLGVQQWVMRYNGLGDGEDRITAMVVDSAGNIYVTGESKGSGSDYDCTTIKYDSSGNQLWIARYNGPANSHDRGDAIKLDHSGFVYVGGYSYGVGTASDYLTIKYSALTGDSIWVRRYNGPANYLDEIKGIALDEAGNVYVTGFSRGTGGDADFATIQYDSDGLQTCLARFSSPGDFPDVGYSVAVAATGNVYVTGSTSYVIGSTLYSRFTTLKYSSLCGDTAWARHYAGPSPSQNDAPRKIALDASGNIYVVGTSYGGPLAFGGTGPDYTTIKYNPDGDTLWVRRHTGLANFDDNARDMALDSFDNIYVTGVDYSGGGTNAYNYATVKYIPSAGNFSTVVAESVLTYCPGGDASFRIGLRDSLGNPVNNWLQVWLDFSSIGGLTNCGSETYWPSVYPIGPSDSQGVAIFYVDAGGSTDSPVPIKTARGTIGTVSVAKSFDTDGNGVVDSLDWQASIANDYNNDVITDWQDFEIWREHVGHDCQSRPTYSFSSGIYTDPPTGQLVPGETASVCLVVVNNGTTGCPIDSAVFQYAGFNIGGTWTPFASLSNLGSIAPGHADTFCAPFVVPTFGHGCLQLSFKSVDCGNVWRTKQQNIDTKPKPQGIGQFDTCSAIIGSAFGFPLVLKVTKTLPPGWSIAPDISETTFVAPGSLTVQIIPRDSALPGEKGSITVVGYRNGEEVASYTCEREVLPIPGSVAGIVRDQTTLETLPGVTVEAWAGNTLKGSGQADANGIYSIQDLKPGDYVIKARANTYQYTTSLPANVQSNVTSTVNLNLEPVVLNVSYSGQEASGAYYVEHWRGEQLLNKYSRTGAGTVSVPSDGAANALKLGDEIYAHKIIGYGRTYKRGGHPPIPDVPVNPPSECPPESWNSFYELWADNQFASQPDNTIRKFHWSGESGLNLSHKIAKLYLVITFEYGFSPEQLSRTSDILNSELFKARNLLLDATNGAATLDSVIVYDCNRERFEADVIIQWAELKDGPKTTGRRAFMYSNLLSRLLAKPSTLYAILFDSRYSGGPFSYGYLHYNFPFALVHELGHYFFGLWDEYRIRQCTPSEPPSCSPDNEDYCKPGANVCIMAGKEILDRFVGWDVRELCEPQHHNTDATLAQNLCEQCKSCWEFIRDDWQVKVQSSVPFIEPCQILRGEPIPWSDAFAQSGSDIPGPHFETGTGSQGFRVNMDNIGPSQTSVGTIVLANKAIIRVGKPKPICFGQGYPSRPIEQPIPNLDWFGYFSGLQGGDSVNIPAIAPNDSIVVLGGGFVPLVFSAESLRTNPRISFQPADSSRKLFRSILATTTAQSDSLVVFLNLRAPLPSPPTMTLTHRYSALSSFSTGMAVNPLQYRFSTAIDTSSPKEGAIIIRSPYEEISLEEWKIINTSVQDNSSANLVEGLSVLIPTGSISGPGYLTVVTSPNPQTFIMGGKVQTPLIPPFSLTLSPGLSQNGPITLNIETEFDLPQIGANLYEYDSSSSSWSPADNNISLYGHSAIAQLDGFGLFSLFGNLCSAKRGDLNADGNFTPADVVLELNCVFLGVGNCDLCFADVNCGGDLTPADVVLELNKVFLGSSLPCQ